MIGEAVPGPDRVTAVAAVDAVPAAVSLQLVVPRPAVEDVVSSAAAQLVGAGAADDDVVAARAVDRSLPPRPQITSGPGLPKMMSGPLVPVIVQASAREAPLGALVAACTFVAAKKANEANTAARESIRIARSHVSKPPVTIRRGRAAELGLAMRSSAVARPGTIARLVNP